jgi:hypothetical protein
MTRRDVCFQRIVLVLLLHVVLLVGYVLALEKTQPGVLGSVFLFVFTLYQIGEMLDDLSFWDFDKLKISLSITDFLSIFIWIIIGVDFPAEGIFFGILQFIYVFRGRWEVEYSGGIGIGKFY